MAFISQTNPSLMGFWAPKFKRHSVSQTEAAWDGTEEEAKTGDNSVVVFDDEAYVSSS